MTCKGYKEDGGACMADGIQEFLEYKGISTGDIPKIPLYMDQLLSFFDESMTAFKRNDDDNILTKTMINNYVKAKVLTSPEKKKYNHTQMMTLVMIYQLKNILSINELKAIVDLRKGEDVQVNRNMVTESYERFIEEEQRQLGEIKAKFDEIKMKDQDEILDCVMSLVIDASLKKRMAEMLLDHLIEEKKEESEPAK